MSLRRFYVPRDSIREGVAVLPPDQSHHLLHVLRMHSGDVVEIFDGEGNGYVGSIEILGSAASIRIRNRLPHREADALITLAAALVKSAKFEWMLQKTTELGIEEIIPLKTRFCEIQIADSKIDSRLERWNRIVQEASKQSRRFSTPKICKPLDFREFLGIEEIAAPGKFLFYEHAENYWRPDRALLSGRIVLCLGPEGGWDKDEVELAKKAGFQICSLGPWILRAETAAIVAVAIAQRQIQLQTNPGMPA